VCVRTGWRGERAGETADSLAWASGGEGGRISWGGCGGRSEVPASPDRGYGLVLAVAANRRGASHDRAREDVLQRSLCVVKRW